MYKISALVYKFTKSSKISKPLKKKNSISRDILGGSNKNVTLVGKNVKCFCLSYPIMVINRIQSLYFHDKNVVNSKFDQLYIFLY